MRSQAALASARPELKVCVEVSREWKGWRVTEDLAGKIKKKVPSPKFILLFATIDYESEFKPILSGMKKAFPDSPLIGGTVAGFTAPQGCYTRGVVAFALHYPNMDVTVGVGHNTKRSPEKAARECAKDIKAGLNESKWENKFLFDVISGTEIPSMPGMGHGVIKS